MRKKVLKILTSATLFVLWASNALAVACTPEGNLPADLQSLLTGIRNVLAAAGIIIAAIFLILGGYNFITSGGSAEKVETARKQIMYALIGIAIILIAVSLVGIVKAIVCT
jgi:hypothetical protein